MKVKPILEGIKNSITKNENIEQLSQDRMAICNSCPNKKGNRCGICGCFLYLKTRQSIQTCPIGKW
jgi:uncharacterized paraquat-inducible protein A